MVALSYNPLTKIRIFFGNIHPVCLVAVLSFCGGLFAKPEIVGPQIYGAYPGTPFIHTLGAINTGTDRTFTVTGLPTGLTLDPKTGIITGTAPVKGRYQMKVMVSSTLGADTADWEIRSGDTLAYVPPMGWNSWNKFYNTVDEATIKKTADAFVSLGLRDLGYHYICIDDTWSEKNRNSAGDMVPKSAKFPSGIKALADYVHARGLKIGIYTDVGTVTFENSAGSGGYYAHDAKMFAGWGIDYVKCDLCSGPQDEAGASAKYKEFGQLIKTSGRSMIFSVCEWGRRRPWLWGRQAGQMWRTSWDLRDTWYTTTYTNTSCGIMNDLDVNDTIWKYSGPGGWNDMDMMFVGMHGEGFGSWAGMTDLEYQTHMSIWCLLASPILLGKDLTITIPDVTKKTLLNEEIIAVNQDVLGKQARKITDNGNLETFTRTLADSSRVVGFLNRGTASASMTIQWTQAGITGKYIVRDLWTHTDFGTFENSFTCDVPSHDTKVLKLFKSDVSPIITDLGNGNTSAEFSWKIECGKNQITIACNRVFDNIEIINIQGKTVSRIMGNGLKTCSFSTADMPSGIYVLKIVDIQGNMRSKMFANK